MSKEAIIQAAYDSIIECDEEKAMKALDDAKEQGISFVELLSEGFSAGIRELGERFAFGEVFLPELMACTEVMQKAVAIIEEEMEKSGQQTKKKGVMVIGTVEGDIHDIGKGIVASMVKTNGIEVHDLGREVPARVFVEKAEEYGADFIGSSALLTTTMTVQKEIEEILKKEGLKGKYKTMVGGAPVTQRWADKIGADAFCEVATEAVKTIQKWLKEMGREEGM